MSNERIEAMKKVLAERRAAAGKVPAKEATPKDVTVAERFGRALARTKLGITGSIGGVSDFIDNIGTSYSYYAEVGAEQPEAPVSASKKQRVAAA